MRTPRRSDIQGLRALAVLAVVAFHANLPISGGFVGVDMFFVISGFVIAGLLLSQLEETSTIDFAEFYGRRAKRLLPALATLLLAVAAASTLLASPLGSQQATARTGLAASGFAANIQLLRAPHGYFDLGSGSNALLHTWSLSVEEQFYFVFPALMLLAWRLTRRFAVLVIAIATVGSFAVSLWASAGAGGIARLAFYTPITRAWEFGIGIVLAFAMRTWRAAPPVANLLATLGVVAVVFSVVFTSSSTPFPGVAAVWPTVGTCALIAAERSYVASAISVRPMRWLGDVSYGWYLWHWPIIVYAHTMWPQVAWAPPAAALGSLLPTWLSYRYVESPLRRAEQIRGRKALALAATCLLIGVASSAGLLAVARLERHSVATSTLGAQLAEHADFDRGCASGPNLDDADKTCRWPAGHAKGTLFLVGDSNAGHFTEGVASAASETSFDLVVATRSACPFAEILVFGPAMDARKCFRYVVDTIAGLDRREASLAIVASLSAYYVETEGFVFVDPFTGEVARTPHDRARLWEVGVRRVLSSLASAHIPAAIVHPVPQLDGLEPRACPFLKVYAAPTSCGIAVARDHARQALDRTRDAEERAVASVPSATAVDLFDDLCDANRCSAIRGDEWWYRDANHLSIRGAEHLASRFVKLIRDRAVPRATAK